MSRNSEFISGLTPTCKRCGDPLFNELGNAHTHTEDWDGPADNHMTLLGATGRVPLKGAPQASRLYNAEHGWGHYSDMAGLTTNHPADFVEQIIHHSSSDNIPGIESLRADWHPNHVVTTHPDDFEEEYGRRVKGVTENTGFMALPSNASFGTISHETAHLLGVHGKQFDGILSRTDTPGVLRTGYDHEWPFARTHLNIVHNHFAPFEAKDLRTHYRMWGVNYRPRNTGHKGFGE